MKRFIAVLMTIGVAGLLVWGYTLGRGEREIERELDAPLKVRARVTTTPGGERVVIWERQLQQRFGIRTVELIPSSFRDRLVAYGTLQADPACRFALRCPIGGVLHGGKSSSWPDVGERPPAGCELGYVQPILSPTVRLDLQTRLTMARAQVEEQQARLRAARTAYRRKQGLYAEGGLVSKREVEEADVARQAAQAQLEAARASVKLIERTLFAATAAAERRVVKLPAQPSGEVVEVAAHPGEVVTQGQTLLVLARYDRLIARVELPGGENLDQMPPSARIVVLGYEDHPLTGEPLTPATINTRTGGQAFLFAVNSDGLPIRPGTAVTAYLDSARSPLEGVDVPRAAVVRDQGLAWVFVWDGGDRFIRRRISLDHATKGGWFVTTKSLRGMRVVVAGAQMLLSETLKSEIRVGEEQR